MSEAPKPDAILYPLRWTPPGTVGDPAAARFAWLTATLGPRPFIRAYGTNQVFASTDPHATAGFPKEHPLNGQSRYTWDVHDDGAAFGTLRAEAKD